MERLTKRGFILAVVCFLFCIAPAIAQDCNIISKANDIIPDRWCSPVGVIWEVSYRGVNDAGTKVQIRYDWDDGSTEIVDAALTVPALKEWSATVSHTYTSRDDRCNYHPVATLVVNGEVCSSSAQNQVVTIWDNDNRNGGHLSINPSLYPVCFGNSAHVRFQDVTRFNCVPPQERDVPNTRTRWIQWIYGTATTMTTGQPVLLNGIPRAYPMSGGIQRLDGPVTGSGVFSEDIYVPDDKFIGQYFQVTLRYWNYCNPYDDPDIPGPPADLLNGDNAPVTRTARILIVPLPDATIDDYAPVCVYSDTLFLGAATRGGQWSGPGIVDAARGAFYPPEAGQGDHIVRYEVSDGNSCSNSDTAIIRVRPGPTVAIDPVPAQCRQNPALQLTASGGSGVWSGAGISDPAQGIFSPFLADTGLHHIEFTTLPDANGCLGKAQTQIRVRKAPMAKFLSADSSWCKNNDPQFIRVALKGSGGMGYDLLTAIGGGTETITGIRSDTLVHPVITQTGINRFSLLEVTEHFADVSCSIPLTDSLLYEVYPLPQMLLDIETSGICHPVEAVFKSTEGSDYMYEWDLDKGKFLNTDTASVGDIYTNTGVTDSVYTIGLRITTPQGCTDTLSKSFPVYPLPFASYLSPDTAYCYRTSPAIACIAFRGMESMSYELSWERNGTGEILAGIDTDTLSMSLVSNSGSNLYVLTGVTGVFAEGSCTSALNDSLRLEIYPLPEIDLQAFPDGLCSPVGTAFNTSFSEDYEYTWDFNDGSRMKTDSSFAWHSFYNLGPNDTLYSTLLKVRTRNGCLDSARVTIPVYPQPLADFNVTPKEQHYPSSQVSLINYSGLGDWSYHWDFGDGETSGQFQPFTHDYKGWGYYEIELKTFSPYCRDSLLRRIHIHPPAPEAAFSPDTAGCGPLHVTFSNTSLYGEYYFWDFDDGNFSNEKNPEHIFLQRKPHQVKLTVTNSSGVDTAFQTVTVYPDPDVNFNVFPAEATRPDQLFKFINLSNGAKRYLWDFGDGNTAGLEAPEHVYGQAGEFTISLYGWNEYNCSDTLIKDKQVSIIEGEGELKYPNAFRWNGSGPTGGYWKEGEIDNTVFHPHSENVIDYTLRIYSRWGELLYESFDLYKGWDGYFNNGELAPQGVYVYKVWAGYIDGRREEKYGNVTFLH